MRGHDAVGKLTFLPFPSADAILSPHVVPLFSRRKPKMHAEIESA
jgi:hypothetical protein